MPIAHRQTTARISRAAFRYKECAESQPLLQTDSWCCHASMHANVLRSTQLRTEKIFQDSPAFCRQHFRLFFPISKLLLDLRPKSSQSPQSD